MKKASKWMVVLGMSLLLITGLAFQVSASEMVGPKAMETDNGIMYMTGGLGIESRAQMDKAADRYNLKVVVASTSGAYLADAMITIKNAVGKVVLKTITDGPWLMVKLPKGTYSVMAAIDDHQKTRKVSVSSHLKTIWLHWKL